MKAHHSHLCIDKILCRLYLWLGTFMCRLVPKLYFSVDNPHQDAVISVAKVESDTLLFPILHDLSAEPPPLVQVNNVDIRISIAQKI